MKRLRSLRVFSFAPAVDDGVPFWDARVPGPPRPRAERLRVLWNGSQAGPVPVIVRDPPDFDPTR